MRYPRKGYRGGKVVEALPFNQYTVLIDSSLRLTNTVRKFLGKYMLPFTSLPHPIATTVDDTSVVLSNSHEWNRVPARRRQHAARRSLSDDAPKITHEDSRVDLSPPTWRWINVLIDPSPLRGEGEGAWRSSRPVVSATLSSMSEADGFQPAWVATATNLADALTAEVTDC